MCVFSKNLKSAKSLHPIVPPLPPLPLYIPLLPPIFFFPHLLSSLHQSSPILSNTEKNNQPPYSRLKEGIHQDASQTNNAHSLYKVYTYSSMGTFPIHNRCTIVHGHPSYRTFQNVNKNPLGSIEYPYTFISYKTFPNIRIP